MFFSDIVVNGGPTACGTRALPFAGHDHGFIALPTGLARFGLAELIELGPSAHSNATHSDALMRPLRSVRRDQNSIQFRCLARSNNDNDIDDDDGHDNDNLKRMQWSTATEENTKFEISLRLAYIISLL